MRTVLRAIDGFGRERVLDKAIDYCREHGAALGLVGVVATPRFDPPQPGGDYEKIRRFKTVQAAVGQAATTARNAGLEPTVTMRAGQVAGELLAEAATRGAEQVFFASSPGPIATLVGHRPRIEALALAAPASPEVGALVAA